MSAATTCEHGVNLAAWSCERCDNPMSVEDALYDALFWISEYPNRTPNSEDDSDAITLAEYARHALDKIDGADRG